MASSVQHEPISEEIDFGAQWRAFARRRLLALFFLYSWVPLCLAMAFFAGLLEDGLEASVALMVIWTGCLFAAAWWAGEFRCPRCRRRYGALARGKSVSLSFGLFDKVCYNCKLSKFELTR